MKVYRYSSGWQLVCPLFCISAGSGSFSVRLGRAGLGLKVTDRRSGWVPFSIRERITPSWRVGPFIVTHMPRLRYD